MQNELIIITEYCRQSHADPSFLSRLEEMGLINIQTVADEQYIYLSQLPKLEQYTRMYYDLSINIEGIDAIEHLLGRLQTMRQEIYSLRNRLSLYETGASADEEET